MVKPQPLDVNAMTLSGVHLIEASAGTGKTYNITRIYLRLIIEQGLSVTQALVMTFTNAATQELRGRLADTLQQALRYWQDEAYRLENSDAVMAFLFNECDQQTAIQRLKVALLEMDEAAIFTLHGFSYRVLTEMAFTAGKPMSESLTNDHEHLYLHALEDWFRINRTNAMLMQSLGAHGWYTPEAFWQQFKSLIYADEPIKVVTESEICTDFDDNLRALLNQSQQQISEVQALLQANQGLIHAELIDGHKQQDVREAEWREVLVWFTAPDLLESPKAVADFLHGNRYRTKANVQPVLKQAANLRRSLTEAAKKCVATRDSLLEEAKQWHAVVSVIEWVKRHIVAEKRRLREVGFDDLIRNLATATRDSSSFAARIRNAYPAALIDEFQDTDSLQYQILSSVYRLSGNALDASDKSLLMMIGDPKQAIYGFRGGDIFTYLLARKDADYQWVMDTNWRSVEGMIGAYNRLFWGADLHEQARDMFGYSIAYEQVHSTPHASAAMRQFVDPHAETRQPLTFFAANVAQTELSSAEKKQLGQRQLTRWCVAEIGRLLAEVTVDSKPIRPADIAILVRTGREAERIIDALRAVNLNAVYLSDKNSLFASAEAQELLRVMTGIWFYQQDNHAVRAASSRLLGISQDTLLAMHQDPQHHSWSELREQLAGYREQWLRQGCLTVITDLLCNQFEAPSNQERAITNYMHLAESLQKASQNHAHPLQLLEWFKEQIFDPAGSDEYQQRLESDADLIQIVTQHKSKGLEYPIVFIPYANEYRDPVKQGNSFSKIYQYFCPDQQRRILQLGRTEHAVFNAREQGQAENMRLLYVAVTRAAQRCYMGISESENSNLSALENAISDSCGSDSMSWREHLQSHIENCQYWSLCCAGDTSQFAGFSVPTDEQASLVAKTFTGRVDSNWRLHSFSGLTKDSHNTEISSREVEVFYHQPNVLSVINRNSQQITSDIGDNRFSFVKGATAGNFLHDLFEHMDFVKPQWEELIERFNRQYSVLQTEQQHVLLTKWLQSILMAPIPCDGGRGATLGMFSQAQTLREAEFYFPLDSVDTAAVNECIVRHRQQLFNEGLLDNESLNLNTQLNRHTLTGMMHGFIDLIFCHQGKFYVADYKSNHLGDSLQDYTPQVLARNNALHNYDLQYLIYSVALHRYLAARVQHYSIAQHFGGVCYLYLRGMHGDNKNSEGVFYHPLDERLISELDRSFSVTENEAQ